jgi:hypothetical protein
LLIAEKRENSNPVIDNTIITMVSSPTDLVGEVDVDALIEQRRLSLTQDVEAQNTAAPSPPPMAVHKEISQSQNSLPTATAQVIQSEHVYDEEMPMTPGHHHADPFAPREGKTLLWKDVNMTLVSFNNYFPFACLHPCIMTYSTHFPSAQNDTSDGAVWRKRRT